MERDSHYVQIFRQIAVNGKSTGKNRIWSTKTDAIVFIKYNAVSAQCATTAFFSATRGLYRGTETTHNATGWKKRSRHLPARRVRSQIRKIWAATNRSFVATRRPSLTARWHA